VSALTAAKLPQLADRSLVILTREIVLDDARRMLARASHAEVDAYTAEFTDERAERGHRLGDLQSLHQPGRYQPVRGPGGVTVARSTTVPHTKGPPGCGVGAPYLCVWWGVVFGGVLLSHTLAGAVPSALEGLASGFGMGPGVSPPLWPP
jgi:hypothetical protein